jgi:hypothetical protein
MEKTHIGSIARDYMLMQSNAFRGDADFAWRTKSRFMHTPGITSFEVSPRTGDVFIGFDRAVLVQPEAGQIVMNLLQEHFPDLIESQRFKRLCHSLH